MPLQVTYSKGHAAQLYGPWRRILISCESLPPEEGRGYSRTLRSNPVSSGVSSFCACQQITIAIDATIKYRALPYTTMYVLAIFAFLLLRNIIADPTTQEPVLGDNATFSDDNGTTRTTLTSSTTTPTVKSRPAKEMSELEGKFKDLGCDMPIMPAETKLWKSNQTHELLLPTKLEDCRLCDDEQLEWDGFIEIQSGDVLLVKIDDSYLVHPEAIFNETEEDFSDFRRSSSEPPTAVYQVTRTGHDHCDVTEGNLLDITPQKIDGQKVVTLYDRDLTDGVNLLIVVSPAWGSRCVRLKVTMKSDSCGENEDCSGKGVCYSNVSMDGYECQCCPGFVGPHCEEQDACYPSPCKNNGICVDISQGHEGSTFQCLCPYGFSGKTCQDETDPCTSMPCQNGATCSGNVTQFRCDCPEGFAGPLCQHNLNDCKSSPCVHGICVDREDGFKCFCEPGFTGDLCEYDYNECSSSPCMNGGTCTDGHATYTCSCGRGFTGKRCHITVDLCEPNPCPEPQYCENHGNNYSCECPKGFTGPDCRTPSRAACSVNPCLNGGTCWSSMHTFYCACRPGFTGRTCETEFMGETITSMDVFSSRNNKNDLKIHLYHLDHLHNIYIAAGTLASACFIVALIVTACHCRVNKTYKRFILRTRPLWKSNGCRTTPQPIVPNNSEWFTGKDKAPTATPSRSLPSLDTTDMYYTLDFSDSQSSPLIQ